MYRHRVGRGQMTPVLTDNSKVSGLENALVVIDGPTPD
jgi:hypothetical protein